MFEEKKARERMFGYQKVWNANSDVFELPDISLMMLLGKKNDKALQLLAEMKNEVEKVVAIVESLTLNHALPDSLLQGTIEYGVGLLNPEFREEPLGSPEWLKKAALFGFHLGRLDRNRIGENPPVALGAHRKALVELFNNNFSVDSEEVGPTKSACLNIIEAAFYTSRRFDLQI